MIYCFTGDGKGKTSAAIGVTVRMLLLEKKVLWVSFYKSPEWDISEKRLEKIFPNNLKMIWGGRGFYIKNSRNKELKNSREVGKVKVYDFDTPQGHKMAARETLRIIRNTGEEYDMVVMDEVLNAINDGLLKVNDLVKVIDGLKKSHVILTGRGVIEEVSKICDLVSEMRKIKHPFDKGVLATKGLDY